jgi:hypothetical protein
LVLVELLVHFEEKNLIPKQKQNEKKKLSTDLVSVAFETAGMALAPTEGTGYEADGENDE